MVTISSNWPIQIKPKDEVKYFIDYFGEITVPRKDINVKHNLLDVIFLTITAVIEVVKQIRTH